MFPLLCLALIGQASVPRQADPVVVSHASVGEAPGATQGAPRMRTAEVDIVNTTDRPVTAWAVAFVAELTDGTTERIGFGMDGYVSYEGLIRDSRGSVIHPHGTVHFSDLLGMSTERAIGDVHATLRYAVFADGSWVGDPQAVRDVFSHRANTATVLKEIVSVLRKAQSNARGRQSLEAALSYLPAPVLNNAGYADLLTLRQNIQRALDGVIKGAPEDLLAYWLSAAEARWKAAERHGRQGPRLPSK
jgi:hypothetical protein